ncbi:unnamed protein product [Cunninghamella blakesleeana]
MEASNLWEINEHPLANAVLWEKPIEDINKTEFCILYMGKASPVAKSKVRQAITPALIKLQKANQQLEQRKKMMRHRVNSATSPIKEILPQKYHLYTDEILEDAVAYKDNHMNLLEYDGTWDLLTIHATEQIVYDEIFIPQNLYTELLPQLIKSSTKQKDLIISPYNLPSTIDLIVYFYEEYIGPIAQDLKLLQTLSIPVLPLIITPTLLDTNSNNNNNNNKNDNMIIDNTFSILSQSQDVKSSTDYLNHLKHILSTDLQRYHIHCLNIADIGPDIPPPFLSSKSNCRNGDICYKSILCYTPSSQEIIHVDQFVTLNCEKMLGLLTKIEYNNITFTNIIKTKQQGRQTIFNCIIGAVVFFLIMLYFNTFRLYEHIDYITNHFLSSLLASLLMIIDNFLIFILSTVRTANEKSFSILPSQTASILPTPTSSTTILSLQPTATLSFSSPTPSFIPSSPTLPSLASSNLPALVPTFIRLQFYKITYFFSNLFQCLFKTQ